MKRLDSVLLVFSSALIAQERGRGGEQARQPAAMWVTVTSHHTGQPQRELRRTRGDFSVPCSNLDEECFRNASFGGTALR